MVRRGQLDPKKLHEMEQAATREWIQIQEEIGLDILVDGEQYRGDMATYFAEALDGFTISSRVRSYGNRYYRKPIATSPIRWKGPITVEWFKFAQGLTRKPVKGMLTGPYTKMDWSFDEHYPNRPSSRWRWPRPFMKRSRRWRQRGPNSSRSMSRPSPPALRKSPWRSRP